MTENHHTATWQRAIVTDDRIPEPAPIRRQIEALRAGQLTCLACSARAIGFGKGVAFCRVHEGLTPTELRAAKVDQIQQDDRMRQADQIRRERGEA